MLSIQKPQRLKRKYLILVVHSKKIILIQNLTTFRAKYLTSVNMSQLLNLINFQVTYLMQKWNQRGSYQNMFSIERLQILNSKIYKIRKNITIKNVDSSQKETEKLKKNKVIYFGYLLDENTETKLLWKSRALSEEINELPLSPGYNLNPKRKWITN